MRWYNAAMREILHMASGATFGIAAFGGMYSWVISIIYSFRAAANRQPGVSWNRALRSVILGSEVYTKAGEKLADRARCGLSGFIVCWLLGSVIGLVWSATANS
jgi:hypothetical protein